MFFDIFLVFILRPGKNFSFQRKHSKAPIYIIMYITMEVNMFSFLKIDFRESFVGAGAAGGGRSRGALKSETQWCL